ncbi:DUF2846 domain-containing protein [Aestuariibacter halophilus]|uniref:DUF2846 domain-containing protein n=1 Tax=Fluctibacter halophilus TaxID=226011 RepID=A0ABS8G8G2_9ALTE|nr:DUF2846 domain-containing protein [Aestuariibacter halophilus]MCC2616867.1 DUF2846 domain-containing protein [Aestuariibacter halophilus]
MRLSLLLIIFLTGCVNTPNNSPTYSQAEVGVPDSEKAVLVLYRKMVPPLIYTVSSTINGEKFANLPNNAFSWTFLPAGNHEVKISWPFLALTPGKTINLDVEAGKYYFVEFGGNTEFSGVGAVVFNTHDISINDYKQGIQAVTSCCGYVPSSL